MRIVHVVRQFHPAIGGMESVVWELASAQIANGHSVRVVTLNRRFEKPQERLSPREFVRGIEIIRIPYLGSRRYPIAWKVLRHIGGADIVHVHGIDFFFDYLAWTQPLHQRKLVVSTHGGYFHTPFAATLKKFVFRTLTRLSLSWYGGVATVSAADQTLFSSIRSRGASLIENGVNIEKYAAAGARKPVKSIITLGRFSTNKRLDRMISFVAALRRLDPAWRLIIAGRPADLTAADLRELAAKARVADGVEILTSPFDDAVRHLMGKCSVIASASSYEGFGLTAVEGMSAGLVPLLNDIPPFRHLLNRHGIGLLTDFSDADGAAEQFLSRWQEIEVRYKRHRKRAIEASADYTWTRVSQKYEDCYHSVLGDAARAILDVPIDVHTYNDALELLDDRFSKGEQATVVFANAHTLNNTFRNDEARAALRGSIVFNDGIGVNLASRLLFGKWFPENLNGTDFMPDYLRHTKHRLRVFFLGAKPGVAERAARHLMSVNARHQIAGCHHGYFDESDGARVAEEIRRSGADVLLVAMGDPMQELWLKNHFEQTACRFGFAVGGLFDFMAHEVPRAPQWVQALCMEWLYRMLQEPRRLWRRYLVEMPVFMLRVSGQWLAGPRITSAGR
jgi:alpha-1,3-mannosyltransferase